MADTDTSSYILRYNLLALRPEYFNGSDWYAQSIPMGGVNSLNTLTGDIVLAAGSNITLTPSGNTITIASSGSSALQILQNVIATGTSSTSSTYVTTGLSQAITLVNVAHRVKITVSTPLLESVDGFNSSARMTVKRDSTDLETTGGGFALSEGAIAATAGVDISSPASFTYIDTPGSVGPFTYEVFFRNDDGVTNVNFNTGTGTAVIILEEIV